MGDNHPIVLQSMTNTDTSDVKSTVLQILELEKAGAEIVRITVNNDSAAKAAPHIIEKLRKKSEVPIVGDFHFNGNLLLKKYPECAKMLDKYRINPGNADDRNFREMIEIALKYEKPVRIGVNSGSVKSINNIEEAVIQSALQSTKLAQKLGLPKDKIVLSAKMSDVNATIRVYEKIAKETNYVLHLGLTEAGMEEMGIVSSSIALGTLLHKGIGNTIRVSLTPSPDTPRTREVEIGKMIIQSLGLRNFRPHVTSCPGCGRTSNNCYQKLAESVNKFIDQKIHTWTQEYPGVENLKIAVMGCVVNGPGESKSADIGISLPGKMENSIAPVYIEGKHYCDLKGENLDKQFLEILEEYISKRL